MLLGGAEVIDLGYNEGLFKRDREWYRGKATASSIFLHRHCSRNHQSMVDDGHRSWTKSFQHLANLVSLSRDVVTYMGYSEGVLGVACFEEYDLL